MKRISAPALLIFSTLLVLSGNTATYPIPKTIERPYCRQTTPVIDIFRSMDAKTLQIRDEKKMSEYLRRQNAEIVKRIAINYPQMDSLEFIDINSPEATWFGLIFAMYEANNFAPLGTASRNTVQAKVPEWLSCTLSVIGSVYGVTELVQSLGTFTVGSAWKIAKFVVKKYVTGWIGTAVALYEVATQCFN